MEVWNSPLTWDTDDRWRSAVYASSAPLPCNPYNPVHSAGPECGTHRSPGTRMTDGDLQCTPQVHHSRVIPKTPCTRTVQSAELTAHLGHG
ncbi:hypothetical protein J6590_037813 [Homalodisca vitripennis]|nr:hypothetical protein J6590_037813 [Homalodisca vitripennis]